MNRNVLQASLLTAILALSSAAQTGTVTDDAFLASNPLIEVLNAKSAGLSLVVSGSNGAAGPVHIGSATTYIKFQLQSSLPPNVAAANVVKATLKLYIGTCINPSGEINLYPVTGAWTESALTQSTAPALAGTPFAANVPVGAALAQSSADPSWIPGIPGEDRRVLVNSDSDLPIGAIVNFGPDLQTVAGGACRQPEGIALDCDGNLYLASNSDAATTVGHVCKFDHDGNLADIIDIPSYPGASAIGLVGELWEGDYLFICDQADNILPHGRVLKVNPRTHEVSTYFDGLAFPNGFAEDHHGNFYVTDSPLGRIYRFTKELNSAVIWFEDPALLSTNPNQNVGANDLAFDADEDYLYVDNAGMRQVFRIPFQRDGAPGQIQLFADGATLDQELGLPSPTSCFPPMACSST